MKRRLLIAGLFAGGLLLGGCQIPTFGAYPGATTQGSNAFKLWQGFFIAGLAVFAIVFALIVWAMFRYRKRSDAIPKQFQYQTAFEIAYTVVPIIMVFVLFAFTVVSENDVTANPAPKLKINITAFQWGWQYTYPGGQWTIPSSTPVTVTGVESEDPTLELPVGDPTRITLQSADVIHGFYVPAFNYSEYAQPGHPNVFTMTPTSTGTFRGQCTQLCGLYHSYMIFKVKVVSPSQFSSWLQTQETHPTNPLTIPSARKLAEAGGGL